MSKSSLLPILGLLTTGTAFAATPEATFLVEHGLNGKSVEQVVETIDQSPQSRPLPYSASIISTTLKLSSGDQVYTLPPGEEFYLSFAPYEWQTHPCFNHSLSDCQDEMPEKAFNVKVTDNKGDVVVQKAMKSGCNSFVGVWLPRDMEGIIAASYNDKTAEYPIKTMEDSQTCLTKLQLRQQYKKMPDSGFALSGIF